MSILLAEFKTPEAVGGGVEMAALPAVAVEDLLATMLSSGLGSSVTISSKSCSPSVVAVLASSAFSGAYVIGVSSAAAEALVAAIGAEVGTEEGSLLIWS